MRWSWGRQITTVRRQKQYGFSYFSAEFPPRLHSTLNYDAATREMNFFRSNRSPFRWTPIRTLSIGSVAATLNTASATTPRLSKAQAFLASHAVEQDFLYSDSAAFNLCMSGSVWSTCSSA